MWRKDVLRMSDVSKTWRRSLQGEKHVLRCRTNVQSCFVSSKTVYCNSPAHVFTVSSHPANIFYIFPLCFQLQSFFSINYRLFDTVCKKAQAVPWKSALHMQFSNKHTCINMQLRDSNQQTNIRSEDISSSSGATLKCAFTVEWGNELSKGQGIQCGNIQADKSCLHFSLSCIKMTHYCLNPVRQHDEAINCARYRFISSLKVLFALWLSRDWGVGRHAFPAWNTACDLGPLGYGFHPER